MAGERSELELKHLVNQAGKILYRMGLADYMGHASARVPGTDRIVIKPRHSERIHGMDSLTDEQMVVIDLDGKLLEGGDGPPGERFIHTEIYRARPDVGGVVHTHQMLSTCFGIVGRRIQPILHLEAPLVAREIPIYPSPELIHTPERGKAVAESLADHPACHLQGHGIVTAAPTVEEAVIAAIHLERLARANLLCSLLGEPRVIPPEEIERLMEPMVGYGVRWSYYASLAESELRGAQDALV